MLKLGRVTKVKVFFLVLVYVSILANFDLFEFLAAILEKGLLCLSILHSVMACLLPFSYSILIDRSYLSSKSTAEYYRMEGLGMVLCHTRWGSLAVCCQGKDFLDTCVYKGNRFKNTSNPDVRTYYKATETFLSTRISLPATHQGSVKV